MRIESPIVSKFIFSDTTANSKVCLGVLIDYNLKWSTHIHHLSLQLSCYLGIFYRMSNLISFEVSKMLYYALFTQDLNSNEPKIYLKELSGKLNNIIRTILFGKKYSHMRNLYKNLNLLKLNNIYKLELAKFMFKFYHGTQKKSFYDRFIKLSAIHNYSTRQKQN